MRDRLIELLQAADKRCNDTKQCENCVGFGKGNECVNYLIADHLLANGVIVPPIGLGRTCFDVRAKCVDECRVSSVTQKADGSLKIRITNLRYRAAYEITPDKIGKTVFLSREEAEYALACKQLKEYKPDAKSIVIGRFVGGNEDAE